MPSMEPTAEQIVELVKQLPLESKLSLWNTLNTEHKQWWDRMLAQGEAHLRRICADRGLNWDTMSEDDREAFVDSFLHEDK